MATFYVLPPRSHLEDSLCELLGKLLPGLPLPVDAWDAVVDRLGAMAGWPEDAYLVPRDDLAIGESVHDSLAADFGAERGDRVLEITVKGTRTSLIGVGMSAKAAAR